ncbi:MAG: DNA circularization N-terminal domain-containing protein [Candidatus Omnitrophica bacterium]|nr:DNA circularization N-terminal domain-containing protein [Candidatus Omnitrophota bacterium]
MSWTDRIQTPTYISPSGLRFEFQYENVEMSVEKKTGEFVFPEIDGAFIQDLGRAGRRFPFNIFFSGSDYDTDSDSFFAALEEKGIGTLEHPLYGTRKVVPTGTITRRDDLITAANQAAFSVTFSETIENITFPLSQVSTESELKESFDNLKASISDQYASSLVSGNATDNELLKLDLDQKEKSTSAFLEGLTKLNENIKKSYTTIQESFTNNIENLTEEPGAVIDQLITLLSTPSNISASASAQIQGYGSAIDNIINAGETIYNNFVNSIAFVAGLFGSLNLSMPNALFTNRPEAISASESIISLFENITTWLDDNITALELPDTGEIYDSILKLYSQTIIYLIDLSFDLPKEIILTLREDRQLIELCAELYGDLDKLDFFIQTNKLNSDLIELLPMGTVIKYYE